MSTRLLFIFISSALLSFPCWALTQFPAGECRLEGVVFKDVKNSSFYLFVNHSTQGETRSKITGNLPADFYKLEKLPVSLDLYINKSTFSEYGEANFIKLEKVLDPFSPPKIYDRESQVRENCGPRNPASTNMKKQKSSPKN
jgi:hypothetical protein